MLPALSLDPVPNRVRDPVPTAVPVGVSFGRASIVMVYTVDAVSSRVSSK